jgi:hypothetical protein
MLIVFSYIQGVVHYEFVPQGQTVNQHCCIDKLQHLHKMCSNTDPKSETQENGFSITTTHLLALLCLYLNLWLKTKLLSFPKTQDDLKGENVNAIT